MAGLSFATPLAYDWKYAFSAIRAYYHIADEIVLGIDRDRISWSGIRFELDEKALADFIAEIDQQGKIRVLEGNFHAAAAPMANDTAERRELGMACRAGNWVVQVDSDEIMVNADEFKRYMSTLEQDCCVLAQWLSVYKIIGDKALVVGGSPEVISVATRSPQRYISSRVTDQKSVLSPLGMLHLSWGRTEEELMQKLTNWSHSRDFDIAAALRTWRSVDLSNYQQLRDFHPMHGPTWPYLQVLQWNPERFSNAGSRAASVIGGKGVIQTGGVTVEGRTETGAMLISFGTPH